MQEKTPEREARRSMARLIADGSRRYERSRHLPRLIPVGPDTLDDDGDGARRVILARLSRAIRAERCRGRAGHWSYDLNRHVGLCQAYVAERRMLGRGGQREPPKNENAGSTPAF